jgi:hypothetical protein
MGEVSGDPPNDEVAQGERDVVLDFMKCSPATTLGRADKLGGTRGQSLRLREANVCQTERRRTAEEVAWINVARQRFYRLVPV